MSVGVYLKLGQVVKVEVSSLHQRLLDLLSKSLELATNEQTLLEKLDGAGEQKRTLLTSKELRIKMHISLSTLIKRVEKLFRFANLDEEGLKEIENDSSLLVAYFKQLKQYLDQLDQLYEECIALCNTAKEHCSSVSEGAPTEAKRRRTMATAGLGAIGFLGAAATAAVVGIGFPFSLAVGTGGAAVSSALAYKTLSSTEIKNKQEELFNEFLEALSLMDSSRSKLKRFFECILKNEIDEITLADLKNEEYEMLSETASEKSEQKIVCPMEDGVSVLQMLEDFVKDCRTFQQDLMARREGADNEVNP